MSGYSYGSSSRMILETVHPDLVRIFEVAIQDVDLTILCGRRGEAEQNYLFETGASQVQWPNSKHNAYFQRATEHRALSRAVDFAPWPIDWNDIERFRAVAFYLRGIGWGIGVELRLGADWDGDFSSRDQTFHDVGHVEMAE